jgi:hypothetical protein
MDPKVIQTPKIGGFFKVACCAMLERTPPGSAVSMGPQDPNKRNIFELRSEQTFF